MMYEIIRNDAADLEDTINEQLIAPWLRFTFGPQALERAARPYWCIEKDPPKDAAARMDLLTKAHGLVDLLKTEVYEAAQTRQPDANEDVVPASAMPTSLFSPGA
jgi:phage gp29-like protein